MALTETDFNNAELNLDHIDNFANSSLATATNRLGVARRTLTKIEADIDASASNQRAAILSSANSLFAAISYSPPVPYAAGISFTTDDGNKTVHYAGTDYAPNLGDLPFTTSGTFETAKFHPLTGVVEANLRVADYAALRASTSAAQQIFVTGYRVAATPSGIDGMFIRDDADTTSADNGGTIIVRADGKRYKRPTTTQVDAAWFGVSTSATAAENTAGINAAIAAAGTKEVLLPPGTLQINGPINIKTHQRIRGSFYTQIKAAAVIATSMLANGNTGSLALQFVSVKDVWFDGNNQAVNGFVVGDLQYSVFENVRIEKCTADAWNVSIGPGLAASLGNTFINCFGLSSVRGMYLKGNNSVFISGAFNSNSSAGIEIELGNENSFLSVDNSGNAGFGMIVSGYSNSIISTYQEGNNQDFWIKATASRTTVKGRKISVAVQAATIDQGVATEMDFGNGGSSMGMAANLVRNGDMSLYPAASAVPPGIQFATTDIAGAAIAFWTTSTVKSRTSDGYLRLTKAAGAGFAAWEINFDQMAPSLVGKRVTFGFEMRGNTANTTVITASTLPRLTVTASDAANATLASISGAVVTVANADKVLQNGTDFTRFSTATLTIPVNTTKLRFRYFFAYAVPTGDTVICDFRRIVAEVGNAVHFDGDAPSGYTEGATVSPGDAAYTAPPVRRVQVVYSAPITADRAVTLNSTLNPMPGDVVRVTRTAAATGAFNVNVGTGPLKALAAAAQWCEVTRDDGGAWALTGFGSL